MTRTKPPFRADHVGSLLRPPSLLEARKAHESGTMSATKLRAAEDEAIREAVRMQEALGLSSVTDGEFRRQSWYLDFLSQVRGVKVEAQTRNQMAFRKKDGVAPFTPPTLRVVERIGLNGTIFKDDFLYLKSLTRAIPKQTIPGPPMFHLLSGHHAIDKTIYPDVEEFYQDIAPVYRAQIAAFAELGCAYLQLDDTRIPFLADPGVRENIEKSGDSPKRHLRMYIDHFNDALVGRPAGLTITTHMCRGNYKSAWFASGAYDYIAEPLFGELNVDGFFLEYDDERSGSFEPLRFMAPGKIVVLGLISTKTPMLESKDEIKRRIDAAAKYVPLERLCLSPQCGFASTVEGNELTIDQQKAKLNLVLEIASDVWGSA
jgi:5-methyltetrahydropteroyltriglutamate--homocysteine methyltransferase